EAVLVHDDAELLLELADQRRLGRLAHLDLAAGELPQARHRAPGRALGDQHASIRVNERAGGDEDGFEAHSNNWRGGGMGGCCRPSAMKGSSRYSSSLANQPMTSTGTSSGSRSTPRPTRRTRTSFPGRWNSFGRRTAWLRPCLKSL